MKLRQRDEHTGVYWKGEAGRSEGFVDPPWYYGMAYWDVSYMMSVWYPIPLNFVVRWARAARYTWDRFRGTAPRWIPYEAVKEELKAAREVAYEAGKQDGYRQGYEGAFNSLNALLDSHEQAARRAVLDD